MAYVKKTWVGSADPLVGDPGSTPIDEDSLNHLETQYDEAVAFTDAQISALQVAIDAQLSAKEYTLSAGANITIDRSNPTSPIISAAGSAVASVNGEIGIVELTQDDIEDGVEAKQYTADEKTKLSGIASGATANQSDAVTNAAIATKANSNNAVFTGTVTIPDGALTIADTNGLQVALDGKQATITNSDSIAQGSTNLYMTNAERTKLTGVATGATANQSDATTNAAIALKANSNNAVFTGTVTIPDGALAIADTSGLQAALDAKAPTANPTFTGSVTVPNSSFALSKLIIAGTPDGTKYLRDDGTWAPAAGGGGSVAWGAVTGTLSSQADLQAALDAKAPLASPAFSGNPTVPNQTAGNNSTRAANTAYVDAAMGTVAAAAQPLDAELTSLAALATNGSVHRTGAGTIAARTLTGSTYISVTNGDGVAGDPTVALTGSVPVTNGGTGRNTSTTAYGLLAAGTTATGAHQTLATGSTGQILKSNGSSALPTFQAGAPADVGLGNVNNTSDASKPVSTAQQTALDLKANVASPTFTGTVGGITKAMVGLGNVDNTADASKTFAQSQITNLTTDLAAKAPAANPVFTGTVTIPDGALAIADTSGLQAVLDAKLRGGTYNITNMAAPLLLDATIVDDGTASSSGADKIRFSFTPVAGSTRPTFWLNEYGELRGMPGRDNTVGWRVFAALDATGYSARSDSVPVFEVTNQRDGTRTTLYGVYKGGRLEQSGNRVGTNYTFASGATVNAAACISLGLAPDTIIWQEV